MPMFHIKKTAVIFVLAFAVLRPPTAHAATIVFSPTHVTVHVGESFSINVAVSTSAVRAYTVKSVGQFTPQIMSLSKWTYNDAWTVLRQPGYDSFDNTLGTWVRTAGFAGGFTGTLNFAKATFIGKAVGKGTIALTNNSFMYDSTSTNIYSGANQVTVEVLPALPQLPQSGSQVTTAPSFDIAVELAKASFQPGEMVTAKVHLTDTSAVGNQLQVPVQYIITKADGTVVLDEENILVLDGVNKEFTYELQVPILSPDTYVLTARVQYPDTAEHVEAKAFFTVPVSVIDRRPSYGILLFIVGLVCGIVLGLIRKRYKR